MRAVAVRYSYYLWQRDRAAGFAVLEYIAEKVTAGLIPNFTAFESVVGLSVIIFCEHYQDKGVLSRLQSIWQGMIATLFRVHEGSSRWKGVVRDFIRERIISFAIAVVFRLFRDLPAYNMVSYEALEAFFQLGTAEKALYRHLVHYFDVDGQYSREQMENDYLAVLKIDNVLVSSTTLMGLVAHACSAPLAFLPFLEKLFEEAKSDVATYPYLTVIANVAINVLYRDPMNDEVFDFFVYTAGICQEYYAQHPETYHNRQAEAPQASTMHPYILTQYRRTGTVKTDWLETRIEAALSQNNLKFFDILLTSELPQVGIEKQQPGAALATLELFFKSSNAQISPMIQSFLARLRVYYPDEVDDFLEEQQVSDDFRLQVRTNEPVERVGDLIGIRPWSFARDSILLGSSELRSQLMSLFEKAADCKDTKTWMEYNIRLLVNVIYGDQVLRQSK